jgi:hypothetical protein
MTFTAPPPKTECSYTGIFTCQRHWEHMAWWPFPAEFRISKKKERDNVEGWPVVSATRTEHEHFLFRSGSR